MRWNIAPESISLVILTIIWIYSRKGSHLPTLRNRIFQGCLLVTFSAMLTNIMSTLMIYQYQIVPLWMNWTVTSVYFILTPLMGMVYFFYVVSIVYVDSPKQGWVLKVGSVPGIIYILMVLMNPFNNVLFDISLERGYVRGPLIWTTYAIFYAYCIASIVVTADKHKYIDRKTIRILSVFPVIALLVIIVQQLFPDIILSGSAATCALLIIYLHLQNKQISLDYLTNVPNRQELLDMLGLRLKRYPDREFTLLVMSIREFRQINNACGQHKGDQFLKAVSSFLTEVGPAGNVYRFSGDEFALLFIDESNEQIEKCVRQILERMKKTWHIEDYQFVLPIVMGIIRHCEPKETLESIISAIEYAVFQAKSGKCGQVCYCDEKMRGQLERKRQIIKILKEKLKDESFEMFYQPIFSVKEEKFLYAESLMRMNDTPIGPIYPDEFIPIAEETGLIIDITYVILDKVCKFINRLREKGIEIECIHVNFSGAQFSQPNLALRVLNIIEENHTPSSSIKIEFTESTLAESTKVVNEFAMEMEQHGIDMGLDDFGTGYSNFATVIRIPFGTVKLDRSLVIAAMDNKTSALAIKNMVRTFRDLGMRVVMEGVETEEQKQKMIEFGVDQIQGYYYSRPLSGDDMERFMIANS